MSHLLARNKRTVFDYGLHNFHPRAHGLTHTNIILRSVATRAVPRSFTHGRGIRRYCVIHHLPVRSTVTRINFDTRRVTRQARRLHGPRTHGPHTSMPTRTRTNGNGSGFTNGPSPTNGPGGGGFCTDGPGNGWRDYNKVQAILPKVERV